MNNNNAQVSADMAAFSAPPPEQAAKEKKAREKKEAQRRVTPEQLKAGEKLSESMKEKMEAEKKAGLIRQLMDYLKLMKEYHPDRVEFLKVPKNFGVKSTIEELHIYIDDIKTELGKKSGLETMKVLWVEGSRVFERFNADDRFGLKVQGLGQAAQNSVLSRRLEDGSIIPGPAVPTLAEFAVEHAAWFKSSVNWRMFLMAMEMVVGVHRMNSQVNVERAQQKPVSKETEEMMDKL